ncbi:Mitochondrial import inner membrane translocase subunit tim22 [Brettanomyces nanus]|uniref:Mitochondrial import inner membrane translocase subunit TIM22 n=1 Tax=Eeniella nana TaxID=13502 RepID=A0A875RT41_EENNA|nr:Mitochondrial import inner membrane translocase subunit tim22 [Brettanomyces nanus]QPG73137.1 Mitochondrial import inner membrane translocase subunit tim22 [Brettanomyces nanus]
MENPFLPGKKKRTDEMTQEERAEYGAHQIMEFVASCPGKTVLSGASGFALGGFFGLFMVSMQYDQPLTGSVTHISELPLKQQMRLQMADMGKQTWRSAKNFGYIGMLYSAVECVLQSFRAKEDLFNGAAAGCITGAGLAIKSGPTAALTGCAGFAAFSLAIDTYMRSENGAPPPTDYD